VKVSLSILPVKRKEGERGGFYPVNISDLNVLRIIQSIRIFGKGVSILDQKIAFSRLISKKGDRASKCGLA